MFNANSEFTIPDQHFITFNNKNQSSQAPLAFMVPDGNDQAAQKRKNTALNWGSPDIKPITTKNKLMNGFRILNSQRRYYSNNVVFRVLDPRGFELEINADNLERLISSATIENGEILSACMWARKRSANYLISEDDELLNRARDNTVRLENFVPIYNVAVGDKVLLQSGVECVYLGRLHPILTQSESWRRMNSKMSAAMSVSISKNKKYFFQVDQDTQNNLTKSIINMTNPRVSQILSSQPMTISESESHINSLVNDHKYHFIDGHGNHEYYVSGAIANYKSNPLAAFSLKSISNIEQWFTNQSQNRSFIVIGEKLDMTVITWQSPRNKRNQMLDFYLLGDITDFLNSGTIYFDNRTSGFNFLRHKPLDTKDFTWSFPQIEITNAKTGNTITTTLRN